MNKKQFEEKVQELADFSVSDSEGLRINKILPRGQVCRQCNQITDTDQRFHLKRSRDGKWSARCTVCSKTNPWRST